MQELSAQVKKRILRTNVGLLPGKMSIVCIIFYMVIIVIFHSEYYNAESLCENGGTIFGVNPNLFGRAIP